MVCIHMKPRWLVLKLYGLAYFSGDVGFSSSARESLLFQRKKEEEDEPLEAVRKYNDSGMFDT